jgi:hypothetical protein
VIGDDFISALISIAAATCRWAYKPGVNFYFEIKAEDSPDEHPIHTFETIEGKHMSDMLTDYAMALLREMGLNADGTKRVRSRDRVAASVAAASAAPPAPAPTLASSPDSYKAVGGDVGSLATAAVRSGDYSAAGTGSGVPAESCDDCGSLFVATPLVCFGAQALLHLRHPHLRPRPRPRSLRLPLPRRHCLQTGRRFSMSRQMTTTTSTA